VQLVVMVIMCVAVAVTIAVVRLNDEQVSGPQPPHLVTVGSAIAVVEGRDEAREGLPVAGVGIEGNLGLVHGRCVGFVADPARAGLPDNRDTIIVWPPGTTLAGSGAELSITSEGKTVRVGDSINAGSNLRHVFEGVNKLLPDACRGLRLVQVGLSS
jgi:hypothetical protein